MRYLCACVIHVRQPAQTHIVSANATILVQKHHVTTSGAYVVAQA
jgi:hypothetical protein